MFRILFIGDVVGRPGRKALAEALPYLRSEYEFDMLIVNAENSAGGFGLSRSVADEFFGLGADVLTLGNHAFDNREADDLLDEFPNIVRPLNMRGNPPGKGAYVFERDGIRVQVVNLLASVFMAPCDDPFASMDRLIEQTENTADIRFLDFHGEASSEKQALAWHLDGRWSALIGTHTHVPTADERIFPQGLAYQTDAGMTGAYDSVIGMNHEIATNRFLQYRNKAFKVASANRWVCGTWLSFDDEHNCQSIRRVQIREDGMK